MKLPRIPMPQKITRAIGKLAFKTKAIKPDICIIAGVILAGGSVVVAITDTWKNKDKISGDISEIKKLKAYEESDDVQKNQELAKVTHENNKLLISQAQKKLAGDIFKTYWKTTVMTGGSIILILSGRKMMRKQIIELSAMYASLLETYRRYRQNVVNDLGREKDQEYAYGIRTVEAIDAETGEVTKKTMMSDTCKEGGSPYSRWLNEGIWSVKEGRWLWRNVLYSGNKQILAGHIKRIQCECNDMLKLYGWLTLNDVYRKLGLPATEEGQHMGWVRGGLIQGESGDDFVDFGVFPDYCNGKYQLPINRLFLDPSSHQKCPLLDFNVICLDEIWSNIYEYDNHSDIVFEKRNFGGYDASLEALNRWELGNQLIFN